MAASFTDDGAGGTVQAVVLKVKGSPLAQIFPTSYTATSSCALLGSPSEGGLKQFDNKVIQPSKVQFSGIVKAGGKGEVFQALRKIMKKLKLGDILCEFQSKGDKIQNMIIESMEEVGDPNRYDAMEIRVSLQEYLEHNSK